ncbi:hypothetical protein DV707_14170 [Halobellus limi]|uniref:Tetrapyrrole (Corrin/Porphyrin) Methylases n=2 Tax=Halobellus limi TaxID=699433 RepID=A0A1H6CPQ9_9EURY|nr:SAM-dependent methyltransferase [Halobellus limi]QCC48711.1 hypothetical protein DV707_14170 [Halobellus limi]SEG74426.1 Tetrapyrrole (Corrin/Porphyrin) Methylases [Halobellus limi]
MVGCNQLTDEVDVALDRSDRIFLLHPHDIVAEALSDRFGAVVRLGSEYEEGRPRAETYDSIVDRVVSAAADADSPVALATYGHPTVGVTPTDDIVRRGEAAGVDVDVRPGISSLDAMYVDLGLNPFETGLQMFEVNDLLLRELPLTPSVPAFLFQVGTVGSRLYTARPNAPERFTRLRRYLERFYPPTHEVSLVRAATLPFESGDVQTFELSAFESMAAEVHPSHTLYVPPVRSEAAPNEEYRDDLYSRAHLDEITADDEFPADSDE